VSAVEEGHQYTEGSAMTTTWSGHFVRFAWAICAAVSFVCVPPAHAEGIQYTLTVSGGNTAGSIGGHAFTQGIMVLTFTGDTDDIIPFDVHASATVPKETRGRVLLTGEATVFIYDLATNASYQATFLPSAGIYVGVDNTNYGFGFGSGGVPPTVNGIPNPAFPGPVGYPQLFTPSDAGPRSKLATWNLASRLTNYSGDGVSCTAFPVSCADHGPPLATTKGNLILNHQDVAAASLDVQLMSIPFSSFSATASGSLVSSGSFALEGTFALGGGGEPFDRATDAIVLRFGPFSASLRAGSLHAAGPGSWTYSGTVSGSRFTLRLTQVANRVYRVRASASPVNLKGVTNPVRLHLTLGSNSGSTTVKVVTGG
jgi:hypothetical protein